MKKIRLLLTAVSCVLLIAGCVARVEFKENLRAGFDVDDTLLFSTPAFEKAYQSDVAPFSSGFWKIVNSSDKENSLVKKKTFDILKTHQLKGDEIFIITARHPYGAGTLKKVLNEKFGVPLKNIYFETEGKAQRIKELNLDIFYGDSDSDIKAALEAGAVPYRIQRSTASSYRKKYNPGRYGEEIIENSEW